MFQSISRATFWLIAVFALMLFSLLLSAQESETKGTMSDNSMSDNSKAEQSVTGCLQKGAEPGGFVLAGDDGKAWELSSRAVKLSDHVGHTVKVTGSTVHETKAHEDKMEKNEKKEAAGKEYGDLKVAKLEMVGDSCK